MKKPHRHAHRAIWLILLPVLLFAVYTALEGRTEPVKDQQFKGVSEQEVFQ